MGWPEKCHNRLILSNNFLLANCYLRSFIYSYLSYSIIQWFSFIEWCNFWYYFGQWPINEMTPVLTDTFSKLWRRWQTLSGAIKKKEKKRKIKPQYWKAILWMSLNLACHSFSLYLTSGVILKCSRSKRLGDVELRGDCRDAAWSLHDETHLHVWEAVLFGLCTTFVRHGHVQVEAQRHWLLAQFGVSSKEGAFPLFYHLIDLLRPAGWCRKARWEVLS